MTAVDLFSKSFQADPYPAYATLREESPVHHVQGPMGSDIWLITRYDDARAALADPRFSKDPKRAPEWAKMMAAGVGDEGPLGANMLNSDPPDHTRQRRLISMAFTRRRIERLRPRIQEITDGLVAAMAEQKEVDLVAALSYPLPITVICELLGIPGEDRDEFGRWTRMLLASPMTPEGVQSRREGNQHMDRYLTDLVATLRAEVNPDLDYDAQPNLISALVVPGKGDQLNERELLGMLKLLLVAGHETTVNLISNGTVALLLHPDQFRLLRERPELMPNAIDEFLRYNGPIERVPMRFTTEDVEIAGTTIPAGSAVNIVLAAADHDPSRFDDPDRLDITRAQNPHLAFGHGVHFCIGAPLARVEGDVAFSTMLARFPKIELACRPEELAWQIGGPNIMRGLASLPLVLHT
ncbi:cytochrome P450 [Micromonospora sp. WMMD882]|uniref:cytochrome P450 family protein n=1 Tax=Micromonospora sp. WMMD882 TaxID=3015151 RepID=UPI00248C21E9|nr:cytochrome P450 [Micromonospora sp. WMMD882]WBB78686.1 cytochrome P450 [Micromonospora sp. WMMD882]